MVTSLLTAVLIFVATPAVLITLVGNPLAHGLGHQWSHGARVALAVLAAVAWVAWAACCTQLIRAVVVQVRRGHVNVPTGALLTDRLAGRIAAGILFLMAVATPLAVGSGAGASGPTGAAVSAGLPTHIANPASEPATRAGAPAETPRTTAPTAAPAYVVRPGDSLWSIAETQLDDGSDWPAIAALNLGRTMPDGLTFVDPSRIYAGWALVMPALPDPASPVAIAPASSPPRTPSVARRPMGAVPAEWNAHGPTLPVVGSSASLEHPGTLHGDGPGHANLPELAALGIGAIACAALNRRARRMRLLRDALADDLPSPPAHSDPAIDATVLFARFPGVPALDAFEAANRALASALGPEARAAGDIGIRAICVGAAGIDFWLAEPDRAAPAGFTLSPDGATWHRPHDALTSQPTGRPLFPIVLPVGDDDAGTWLIPLEPGACLPLVGEAGPALWHAARSTQMAWSWSDLVVVTDDPQLVLDEVRLWGGSGRPPDDAQQILYFGAPADLPGHLAQGVSIVTHSPAPASDLIVLVDRRGASIHPLGRTVRPHLMDDETFSAVSELIASPFTVPDRSVDPGPGDGPEAATPTPDALPAPPVGNRRRDTPAVSSPGFVQVKLLTPRPRIEGLSAPLPSNREWRAVELVAYLALQQGAEVTSDRLRTRVLGTSDTDAARTTLSNIAGHARTALGTDQAGMPLFPYGSRTGHFRVSKAVSVDVHEAARLATQGGATQDPGEAMDLLRAALSLIEGEPLSLAHAGYSWWDAEGHGGLIGAVLVNAAGNLAALAVEAGLFDLAHWGLEQARLLTPFSEAISRTAMQVAAAAGDADRLRREWRECQRRMDELDPGGTPTGRTERLYGELIRQLSVSSNGTPRP